MLCALGALYGALLPSSAGAAGVSPPVADCSAHGKLTRHYSPSVLRNALQTMPADVAEYTNCPNVIRRAMLAELGTADGGSGGGGGSFLPAWVIVVLVVIVLAGAGAGVIALRNRRRDA